MSDDLVEAIKALSPNNQRKLSSAVKFVLGQLDKGYYGILTVGFVVEDGSIQSVRKTRSESEK